MSEYNFSIIKAQEIFNKKQEEEKIKSFYQPNELDKIEIQEIIKNFSKGWQNAFKPRPQFDDLSLIDRMSCDLLSSNTYIQNNGERGNEVDGWRSTATRPIIRNKLISILSQVTTRVLFPKVFARNEDNNEEHDAAIIMSDLLEYAGDQMKYKKLFIQACMNALSTPASIMFLGFFDTKRKVKTGKKDNKGEWLTKEILDNELSGFKGQPCMVDQIFIPNFFEYDIQKQDWVIWRKVISYDIAKTKYKHYENWKYVKKGLMTIFNQANQSFYDVYDYEMQREEVEELFYWNRYKDTFHIIINGVKLTEYGNPNPREDKKYPFAKFGYELINGGNFFYYKSMSHKGYPEAEMINDMQKLVYDGTYLNVFQPAFVTGEDAITSEVIAPANITIFRDPNSSITPINVAGNLRAGVQALQMLVNQVDESAPTPQESVRGSNNTAYEVQTANNNASIVIGLFMSMIAEFVEQTGEIMIGDIIQYLTILEASEISDKKSIYKSFVFPDKTSTTGEIKTRKLLFDSNLHDEKEIIKDKILDISNDIYEQEEKDGIEIFKANPKIFRKLKYSTIVSPDIMNPISEESKRGLALQTFDRAVKLPNIDLDKIAIDFLFKNTTEGRHDPERFLKKQEIPQEQTQLQGQPTNSVASFTR